MNEINEAGKQNIVAKSPLVMEFISPFFRLCHYVRMSCVMTETSMHVSNKRCC